MEPEFILIVVFVLVSVTRELIPDTLVSKTGIFLVIRRIKN